MAPESATASMWPQASQFLESTRANDGCGSTCSNVCVGRNQIFDQNSAYLSQFIQNHARDHFCRLGKSWGGYRYASSNPGPCTLTHRLRNNLVSNHVCTSLTPSSDASLTDLSATDDTGATRYRGKSGPINLYPPGHQLEHGVHLRAPAIEPGSHGGARSQRPGCPDPRLRSRTLCEGKRRKR